MLPPSPREFKDIFVVFELMETDLHQARQPPAIGNEEHCFDVGAIVNALNKGEQPASNLTCSGDVLRPGHQSQ